MTTTTFITHVTRPQATRRDIAIELYEMAERLDAIAQACSQQSLFDDLTLDYLDRLAASARVTTDIIGGFADDAGYSPV